MLTLEKEREVAHASAAQNLSGQVQGLEAIQWKAGATILDIGCGPGVHLDYFRSKDLIGTGLDRNPDYFEFAGEIEHVRDIERLEGREFDYVFASHVLEHSPNPYSDLLRWRALLKDGGTIIIFVPPFENDVSNDHWSTGWNVGQLAMTLVAAGFDCRDSTFYQTGNQVFGFGVKRDFWGKFIINESLPHLPEAMSEGLNQPGEYLNLRGDIAFVSGRKIKFLPRRPAELSVPMPDETWLKVEQESWSEDAIRAPSDPISTQSEYVLAIESNTEGPIRIAFTHDRVSAHAELWVHLKPGITVRRFVPDELQHEVGRFNVVKTDLILIGGPTGFSRAALFCEGRRII